MPTVRIPVRSTGFFAGPALCVALWLLPEAAGLTPAAQRVAGLAVWMAVWWLTVPVSLPVTALLPLLVLPLVGHGTIDQAARPYADPII
ncbi:MAG: anion permease, partial [Gemmatimonadales bacterium]